MVVSTINLLCFVPRYCLGKRDASFDKVFNTLLKCMKNSKGISTCGMRKSSGVDLGFVACSHPGVRFHDIVSLCFEEG